MKRITIIRRIEYIFVRLCDWLTGWKIQLAEWKMMKRLEYEDDWWWAMEQPGFFPPSYCREHTPEEIESATRKIVEECRKKIAEL